ncbi:MAG: NTP transferase domain-containing protein [Bacteroidetes bacterium]|nr:NTP transferase domain-containing protein [Bacteroidota bacterium]
MKAVIPVAGVGTKLRPHTHTQPKPLIPVAGKPILGHIIDNLISAGIRKQVFIIGYLKEKIKDYVESEYKGKIEMEFVVQEPRKGLAHALWVSKPNIQECEEILVILGDTIFGDDTKKIVDLDGAVLAVHQVDDPREFGIARLDKEDFVKKLTEKPSIPTSNLALVGLYKITPVSLLIEVLDEMMNGKITEDSEYSLTDALMKMIRKGTKFRTYRVENWFDCGRKQSLLMTNRILLERGNFKRENRYKNSVIIPPVFIAKGCQINNSIIGPYTAIAENAKIENSIVKNSILGAYSRLDSIILNKSVVGNDTTLKGKANSINIGDNTEIDFDE